MKKGDLKKQGLGTSGTRRRDQGTRKSWDKRWRKAGSDRSSGKRKSGSRGRGQGQGQGFGVGQSQTLHPIFPHSRDKPQ